MLTKVLPTGLYAGLAGAVVSAPQVVTLNHAVSYVIPAGRYILYSTDADMDLEIVTAVAGPTWTKIRDGADTSGLFMLVVSDGASVRLRNSHGATDNEVARLLRVGSGPLPSGHAAGAPDQSFPLPQVVTLATATSYVIPAGLYYLYGTGADVDLEIVTDPVAPTWTKIRDGADAAPTPIGALIASDGFNLRLSHTGAAPDQAASLIRVGGAPIPTGIRAGLAGSIFSPDITITLDRTERLIVPQGWYYLFTDAADMDLEVVTSPTTPTWTKIRDGAETQPAGILFYSDGVNVAVHDSAAAVDNVTCHLIKVS